STWSPDSGRSFTPDMLERIVADLNDPCIKRRGLSLSGGDPLYPSNCPTVLEIVRAVRQRCPGKDIWLWTGYRIEDLFAEQRAVVDHVDVLVDGRFVKSLADASLPFRGSSNQRIIPVAEARGGGRQSSCTRFDERRPSPSVQEIASAL
ncbi:MAG: anaerobic ribonucleoside-triphosphate reductase activating protein, partial [Puniceicoccales bacterium]